MKWFDKIKVFFKRKAKPKKIPRKVDIISVHDYPKIKYTAWYELRVNGDKKTGYQWGGRIYDYASSEQLEDVIDAVVTLDDAKLILPKKHKSITGDLLRDAADYKAQSWAKETMKKYQRSV